MSKLSNLKSVKKDELINLIAARTSLPKTSVLQVLDALGLTCQDLASELKEVQLPGIGKMTYSHRSARNARHPQTKEPMLIAAQNIVSIKAIPALKKAVLQDLEQDTE